MKSGRLLLCSNLFHISLDSYSELLLPVISEMTNRIRKIKNKNLAMEAAAATRLKKPNTPAISAITRKIADHFNMIITPLS